ncbi:MAG TPA: hypothetical protein VN316_01795 [candidate division Zixibacteria bacterium]|nr:hypothetical protein [candidate division Zixibacteria bacterium]
MFKKIIEEKTLESGEFVRHEKQILIGFRGIPVFRFEDTEGALIIKEDYRINP